MNSDQANWPRTVSGFSPLDSGSTCSPPPQPHAACSLSPSPAQTSHAATSNQPTNQRACRTHIEVCTRSILYLATAKDKKGSAWRLRLTEAGVQAWWRRSMSCSIRTWPPHALDAAKTQAVTSCCIPCLSRWLVLTGYWNSERRVAPCISAIVQSDSGAPDESNRRTGQPSLTAVRSVRAAHGWIRWTSTAVYIIGASTIRGHQVTDGTERRMPSAVLQPTELRSN